VRGPLDNYLDVLTGRGQGDGWIELRFRHEAGMRTRFYRAGDGNRALARCVHRLSVRRDVYLGCALRTEQRGDRAHVGQAWTLWAECDGEASAERLESFNVVPSLLIASGTAGHLHAYWALAEPIAADELENANRRLSLAVSGDPVCFDAPRILRPPGTRNHKYSPSRPVHQLGDAAPEPYSFASLLARLPQVSDGSPASVDLREAGPDVLLKIAPERYVTALLGRPISRDRKISCPFHDDRTPSLHVYPVPERGWFCFGCRRGGSIYDLAAALWGLEPRGADFLKLRERLFRLLV
jgi:hypothetical protein